MKKQYKTEGINRYLILWPEDLPASKMACNMLLNNQITGLLPFSVRETDGNRAYYYTIEGKQPINHVWKQRQIELPDVLRIFDQVMQCFYCLNRYLLPVEGLLLEAEDVYYREEDQSINLCYVPGLESDVAQSVKNLAEIFMDHVNHKDERAVVFVYGLYRLAGEENCSLLVIQEYLQSFMQREQHRYCDNAYPVPDADNRIRQIADTEYPNGDGHTRTEAAYDGGLYSGADARKQEIADYSGADTGMQRRGDYSGSEFIGINTATMDPSNQESASASAIKSRFRNKNATNNNSKDSSNQSSQLPQTSTPSQLPKTPRATSNAKFLKTPKSPKTPKPPKTPKSSQTFKTSKQLKPYMDQKKDKSILLLRIHIMLTAIALCPLTALAVYFCIRHSFNNMAGTLLIASADIWLLLGFCKKRAEKQLDVDMHQTTLLTPAAETAFQQETVARRAAAAIPYLKPAADLGQACITIDKTPVVIGSLQEAVDACIRDTSISRLHAAVEKKNDEYYLTDLESTNGTYLNGHRITPQIPMCLQHGDRVSFGKKEYEFCVHSASPVV